MPIIFISLNETYTEKIREYRFEARTMKIQDYIADPTRRTYYISPANSFCFMDGGIDYALSRIIFPGIETDVRNIVKETGIKTIFGRPYLPIGSSIILDRDNTSLVVSPTMLLQQNVSNTNNAYYATIAILYKILVNRKENLDDVDIIFTSLCCGYGKMSEDVSIQQCVSGIRDYTNYNPIIINDHIILNEPNLEEQPKYYQNTEFFLIEAQDIIQN